MNLIVETHPLPPEELGEPMKIALGAYDSPVTPNEGDPAAATEPPSTPPSVIPDPIP